MLATHPDEALLLERAGIAALRLGRTAEATALLDRATQQPDAGWRAWNSRGVAADRQGRWDEVDAAYARAAELDPTRAEVPNNLGWSLMLRGRWPEALAAFERAAALDPNLPRLANNLELARAAVAADLPHRLDQRERRCLRSKAERCRRGRGSGWTGETGRSCVRPGDRSAQPLVCQGRRKSCRSGCSEMTLVASAPQWLAAILFFLLLLAALEDLWRLQIEDWTRRWRCHRRLAGTCDRGPSHRRVAEFPVLRARAWPWHILFARGWMGGGDIKLLAASALWFDLGSGWKMLVAVAIAGGLEVITVMLLRLISWPQPWREKLAALRRGEDMPYGVAIVAGVVFMGLANKMHAPVAAGTAVIVAADGQWAALSQGRTCEAAAQSVGTVAKDRPPARASLSFDAGGPRNGQLAVRLSRLPRRAQP